MTLLAGQMEGNQGAPGQVGTSGGLFLDRQSEIPDNHDTELYFTTGELTGDAGLQFLTFKAVKPGYTARF